MSKEITEWINRELYPTLYDRIDTLLPEFQFKARGRNWVSSNKRKVTGEDGNSTGKVNVYANNPGRIVDYRNDHLSLVDYIMKRDRVEFIQAVKTLAEAAGLSLPRGDVDPETYKRYKEKADILEACNGFFISSLSDDKGSDRVRAYLSGRGYSEAEIEAMELGYIPSLEELNKHLLNKGYTRDQIAAALTLDPRIGQAYKLCIPYRSGGTIKGFKFRALDGAEPKYLNNTGLEKMAGFFNISGLKGDKDVVIVEGELDSLSATVRGENNVVAAGGSTIGSGQILDAISRGAKSFTICFDNDPGREEQSQKEILQAADKIREAGIERVYIATLPSLEGGKTDPDRLIKEAGIEAFRGALFSRLTYGAYLGSKILEDYLKKANEAGEIDYKERDILTQNVAHIRYRLSAADRIDFNKHLIEPLRDHGITEDIISTLEEENRAAAAEAQRSKAVTELLKRVSETTDSKTAISSLKDGIKDIDTFTGRSLLPQDKSFNDILEEIANLPAAYKTGYPSLDKFLSLTPGTITLVAGRTSHGKTSFMFNLLVEMSLLYPDKRFYLFSYEEPARNIYVKILNRIINKDFSAHYRHGITRNYQFLKSYISSGRDDIAEIEAGKQALKALIDSNRITVIDQNYSVEELYSLISYLNKAHSVGTVFIDYIQRIGTARRTQDKRTEVAHVSDQVLQIAKDTGLPIILGAQLNREATSSKSKTTIPRLENLKEAGNLEEDANTVLSVYNESIDKPTNDKGEPYKGMRYVPLEIAALKNREGEANVNTFLTWDKWTGHIKDTEQEQPNLNPYRINR
jgi:DNA primase